MASPPDTRPERSGELSPVRFGAWLCALASLGVYERLCVPGPPSTLAPTDAYYYGRLAWLSRLSFPRPVTFDAWTGYPGMPVQWPPGHAWLLAALQALFGARAPFSPEGLAALSWAGPILSLSGIALLTLWAARRFGRWTALATAGVLLVQPLIADVGQLGEADHHLHEAFFAAAVALCVAGNAQRRSSPLWGGLLLGLLSALPYLFTSSGFLYLPPIAALALLAHALRAPDRFRCSFAVATAAATALLLVTLGALALGRLGQGDYVRLSGFHVALHALVLAAACVPLLFAPEQRLRRYAIALGLLSLALLAPTAVPSAYEIARAAAHLGRGSVILAGAEESAPLLSGTALELAAGLVIAVPLLAFAALLARRTRGAPAWLVPLAGWLLTLAAFTILQARFARPLLGVAAVLSGLLVQRAAEGGLRLPASIAARLAALALLVPPPIALQSVSEDDARFIEGLEPALAFLRTHTPSAGDPFQPGARPAWAVLADWNLGHLVVALAERPALASPFGQTAEAEAAAQDSRRLLQSSDSLAAARECAARSLRYALLYEAPRDRHDKLRERLASGEAVPGFRAVYVGAPGADGRIPRVFAIDPSP